MHDDSDIIQASTPGNIRLPRLWANSKEMKTDTYSDRFSTTCRNNSTMSSSGTTSHSRAYVHHTNLIQSGDSIRKWPDSYSKTCLSSLYPTALSGHLTGPLTQGVFMSHLARAAAAPVPDANAHFPSIRRTGQQARTAPPRHRYHRHMIIPQNGQKTGHSGRRGAVSYSEIPLNTVRKPPSVATGAANAAAAALAGSR